MARFEAFWEVTCDFMHFIWLGVMVVIFLGVLTVIALLTATPGTAAFGIAIFNAVILAVMGTISIGMFRVCVKRRDKEY